MIHQLIQEQTIPAPLEAVWTYFATPQNLTEMTPPEMNFEIMRGGAESMHAGQMIEYRVSLFPGVKTRWLTEITHVIPQEYFVDEQRIGPYRIWHHEHHFLESENGTHMTDTITYTLPFGPLGDIMHSLWVRYQLKKIFEYRYQKINALFKER